MRPQTRSVRRLLALLVMSSFIWAMGWPAPRPAAAAGAQPIGAVTITETSAAGWACDPDDWNAKLWIHFYKDHNVFIGSALANGYYNAGVAAQCGGNAAHGFYFSMPASLSDGLNHSIYAYALDSGGGTNPVLSGSGTPIYFANHPVSNLFLQPWIAAGMIDDTIVDSRNDPPPPDTYHIRFANLDQDVIQPIGWDMSPYTGFTPVTPTPADNQRGISATPGDTAAQSGDDYGLFYTYGGVWINSESGSHSSNPSILAGPEYRWSAAKRPQPWAPSAPNRELGFAVDLMIPTAARGNGGEVMVAPNLFFRDTSGTQKAFWLGAQIFDLRPASQAIVMDSSYTPVLNDTLGNGSQWLHTTPRSSGFQQAPWSNLKRFEFRINRDEFQQALADLRAINVSVCDYCSTFSANPADYVLEQVNMNAKIYDPTAATWGKLGMSYTDMRVDLYATPVYDRVYIRGALAVDSSHLTVTPTTQVFFKNPGDADYSQAKSLRQNMTLGGGWHEIMLDMSANPAWKGTISGLRVDPFDSIPLSAAEGFGIDYIYVGDANRNYIRTWDFNGATGPSNPFFGWQLSGIFNHWTDGNYWGGSTNTGDPRFAIDNSFPTGK